MRRASARDQTILILVGLVVLGLCYFIEARVNHGQIGAPLDDTYIHMRFAENLLAGQGFCYNPGEPMPGSTSPLWVLLVSLGGLFTRDLLKVSLLFSSLFYLIMGLATCRLASRILSNPDWALPAGLLTLLTPRLLWAGALGMEPTLFACLCLFAVDIHARDRAQGRRPSPLAALLFGLATQARPEGYLLFAFALLDNVLGFKRQKGKLRLVFRGIPWISIFIYGLIILPYMAFAYKYTGQLFSTSFQAKQEVFHWATTWRYISQVVKFFYYDNLVLYAFLPFGAGALFLRWLRNGTEGDSPGWVLIFYWTLGYLVVSSFLFPIIRHYQRYLIPVLPFYILVCLYGLQALMEGWKKIKGADAPRFVSVVVLALAIFWGAYMTSFLPEITGRCVKNIREMQVTIGEWLRRGTFEHDFIAANDVGAIIYISKRRVLDLCGLMTPEIIPRIRKIENKLERDRVLFEFLAEKKPDYLIIFPSWYPTLARDEDIFVPVFGVRLQDNIVCGGDEMILYKCLWDRLQQDQR
jgi:arabinofuranosyltransferase